MCIQTCRLNRRHFLAGLGDVTGRRACSSHVLFQLSLILVMTVIAILPLVIILPKLSAMLRAAAISDTGLPTDAGAVLYGAVSGLGLMGLLHLFFGSILVTFGVRRCYRYV